MPKYIITYNNEAEIIEAENEAEAETVAYEAWLNDAEQNWEVHPYDKEKLEEFGLERDLKT